MASILNAGAHFLNNVLSPTPDSIHVFRQEICRRMTAYESSYRRQHDSTVCKLYAHWFMSLLAFAECLARYFIHLAGILVISVLFYFFVCVTCGKSTVSIRTIRDTQFRLFGLYWGLSCGIFWNLVVPWRPPMYAFRVINLTRPDMADVESLQHLLESAVSCDCCCQCAPDLKLPVYKILQGFLISYGGCSAGTCGDLDAYVAQLRAEVIEDNIDFTREFYMKEYGFPTYEETIRAHSGGAIANAYTPSAPPAAPTVVVATALPCWSSDDTSYATVVQAQPASKH